MAMLLLKYSSLCLSWRPDLKHPDCLRSFSADIPRSVMSRKGSVLIAVASQLQKNKFVSLTNIASDSISPGWRAKLNTLGSRFKRSDASSAVALISLIRPVCIYFSRNATGYFTPFRLKNLTSSITEDAT